MAKHSPVTNSGFFIHPTGVLVSVPETHIKLTINHHTKFGLTKEYINTIFKKYNEPLYLEGKAREEIIKKVLNKGWVRIRRYNRPRVYWSIQFDKLTPLVEGNINSFCFSILKGVGGKIEKSKNIEVVLAGVDGFEKRVPMEELAIKSKKMIEMRDIEDLA